MNQFNVTLDEKHHRLLYSIKYTFIRRGEITISNAEVIERILDFYAQGNSDIMEIPDFTYKNYVGRRKRSAAKNAEPIKRKRGRPKKEE